MMLTAARTIAHKLFPFGWGNITKLALAYFCSTLYFYIPVGTLYLVGKDLNYVAVVNYVNPTTVHGTGLCRFAPKLKSFALSDSPHMPHMLLGRVGMQRALRLLKAPSEIAHARDRPIQPNP
jgi:hypothetical protein